jgi:hypothetical protein
MSRRVERIWSVVLCGVVGLLAATWYSSQACAWAEDAMIVENGRPRAVLVVSAEAFDAAQTSRGRRGEATNPLSDEILAATEIQSHIEAISSVELDIVRQGNESVDSIPIFIGAAAEPSIDEKIRSVGDDPSAFMLSVDQTGITIRGLSPAGTLCGAYEMLEQLGVRWFMPGEMGLVIPTSDTIFLPAQSTIQVPSFAARNLQGVRAPEWERRMRLGGLYFPASHGVHGLGGARGGMLFEEHPEYFSLIDGQRRNRQLCVSNPDVVRLSIEAAKSYFRENPYAEIMGIGANDGRGFCECENCLALDGGDYDPFGHYPSMTDRYVWFFNQILAGIEDEFPEKRLGFYAYSVYNRPPVKVVPDRRLVPAVALITLCRLHGMDNPICPEKSYEQQIISEWGRLVPEVYYRGYWFNLADPGLPYFMLDRIRHEVPLGRELGITGWRVESPYEWAGSAPSRYVASKLMWNADADVDAILADFYVKFGGPAAASLRMYVETMDFAVANADFHTGSSWDAPHVYTPESRATARAALDAAAQAAPDGIYAQRIAMYRRSLDHLDSFVDMMDRRARHDYAGAKAALDRIESLRAELLDNDPPLITRAAESYMNRFFSKTTLEGYERTTGGNELIIGLDDVWMFQIDPEQVGEAIGWFKPEHVGGNWTMIRTSTQSWSNQGLRYYKGLAWYRQSVEVPASYAGKRIFLWCGGIDEQAKIWVNGQEIGISPKGSFTPFEIDATEAVQAGETNTIVFCVGNMTLNEVGTGGITGPVMLYAPFAGDAATPTNAKPPATVFPEY